jgi:hypothetical protein
MVEGQLEFATSRGAGGESGSRGCELMGLGIWKRAVVGGVGLGEARRGGE